MADACNWAKCTRVGVCTVYLKLLGRRFCAPHCGLHRESLGIEDPCDYCTNSWTIPAAEAVPQPTSHSAWLDPVPRQTQYPAGQQPQRAVAAEPYPPLPDTAARRPKTPAAQPAQYPALDALVQCQNRAARRADLQVESRGYVAERQPESQNWGYGSERQPESQISKGKQPRDWGYGAERQSESQNAKGKQPRDWGYGAERQPENQNSLAGQPQYSIAQDSQIMNASRRGTATQRPQTRDAPAREPEQKQPPRRYDGPPPILKSLPAKPVPKAILKPQAKLEFQISGTDIRTEQRKNPQPAPQPAPVNQMPPPTRGERPWAQHGTEGQRRPRQRPYSLRDQPPFTMKPGAPDLRRPPAYSDSEYDELEGGESRANTVAPARQQQQRQTRPEQQPRNLQHHAASPTRPPATAAERQHIGQDQQQQQLWPIDKQAEYIQPSRYQETTTYALPVELQLAQSQQRRKVQFALTAPEPDPSSPVTETQPVECTPPPRQNDPALQPLQPVVTDTTVVQPLQPVANRHPSASVKSGHPPPSSSRHARSAKTKRQSRNTVIPNKKPSTPKPRQDLNEHRTPRPRPDRQQMAMEPAVPAPPRDPETTVQSPQSTEADSSSGSDYSAPQPRTDSDSDSESETDPSQIPLPEGNLTDDSASDSDDSSESGTEATQTTVESIASYPILEQAEAAALDNVYKDGVPIAEAYQTIVEALPAHCFDDGQEDPEPDIDVYGNPRPRSKRAGGGDPNVPSEPEAVNACPEEPIPKPQISQDFEEFPGGEDEDEEVRSEQDSSVDTSPGLEEYYGEGYCEDEETEAGKGDHNQPTSTPTPYCPADIQEAALHTDSKGQEDYEGDPMHSPDTELQESSDEHSDRSSPGPSQAYIDGSSDPIDEVLSLWDTPSLPDYRIPQTQDYDYDPVPWHTSKGKGVATAQQSDNDDDEPEHAPDRNTRGKSNEEELYTSDSCYTKNRKHVYALYVGKRPGVYGTFPEMQNQTPGAMTNGKAAKFLTLEEAKESFVYSKKHCGWRRRRDEDF